VPVGGGLFAFGAPSVFAPAPAFTGFSFPVPAFVPPKAPPKKK